MPIDRLGTVGIAMRRASGDVDKLIKNRLAKNVRDGQRLCAFFSFSFFPVRRFLLIVFGRIVFVPETSQMPAIQTRLERLPRRAK